MSTSKSSFGLAPTKLSVTCPFLITANIGMLITLKAKASSGSSSTFTLQILALPSYSSASSATTDDIIRHGPHQAAQKSISTGSSVSFSETILTLRETPIMSATAASAIMFVFAMMMVTICIRIMLKFSCKQFSYCVIAISCNTCI